MVIMGIGHDGKPEPLFNKDGVISEVYGDIKFDHGDIIFDYKQTRELMEADTIHSLKKTLKKTGFYKEGKNVLMNDNAVSKAFSGRCDNVEKQIEEKIEKDIMGMLIGQLTEDDSFGERICLDDWFKNISHLLRGCDGEFGDELVVREKSPLDYTTKYLKQLKRHLKYAKHPMETRQLNRKINEVARELKRSSQYNGKLTCGKEK